MKSMLALLALLSIAACTTELSIHCEGTDLPLIRRMCHLKNVCLVYSTASTIRSSAFIDEESAKHNQFVWIDAPDGTEAQDLCHVGTYTSTPVFRIRAPTPSERLLNVTWYGGKSDDDVTLLGWRSQVGNFFHAFADEYLSLWNLLEWAGKRMGFPPPAALSMRNTSKYETIFMDDLSPSYTYSFLEDLITPNKAIKINEMSYFSGNDLKCFKNLFVGPGELNLGAPGQSHTTGQDMNDYASFVLSAMGMPHSVATPSTPQITIVQRSNIRVILNIDELDQGLRRHFPCAHVKIVNLESLSFRQQLTAMQQTSVLIGMHGASMIHMLFLPRTSSIIELLPYKVPRPIYGILARRVGVAYDSWQCLDEWRAVFHDEYLAHLPAETVDDIKHNVGYSPMQRNNYWVNQDMVVDVDTVVKMIDLQCKDEL